MRKHSHIIQERYDQPRCFGELSCYTHSAQGDNPFCGDTIQLYFRLKEDQKECAEPSSINLGDTQNCSKSRIIEQATFDGYACSLCIASTDLLLEHITGRQVEDALALTFNDLLMLWDKEPLEVSRARKGCVELPLRILSRALED